MLKRLLESSDPADQVEVQKTTLALDVLGRYICSTFDEAANNGGFPFDAVVLGAGMYGAYTAEKIYRGAKGGMRVLVLDAGTFLVSEHVQNLARIGLNVPGATNADPGAPRERVWGLPWRSQTPFVGLAYCIGGRSLYWGGWSPRLTDADLKQWPKPVADYLVANYNRTEQETGVDPTTDYISGALFTALSDALTANIQNVPTADSVSEAPLAVQGAAPAPGLFAFDKYSSAPILSDAVREAAAAPDSLRRLFVVPNAHVVKLHTGNGSVQTIELSWNGQRKFLPITPECAVVLALGTIESTRLALESFPTGLMGRNLMAHLRTNLTVRIKKTAFGTLPSPLGPAAALVRGSTPKGRYHMQITAVDADTTNSESTMWRMVPDIDLLDQLLASQDFDKVTITFRCIGEMTGDQNASNTNPGSSWMDLSPFEPADEFGMRRGWVNLVATAQDRQLWDTMDTAALNMAQAIAKAPGNIEYFYGGGWQTQAPPLGTGRDGLGTTHHEAGTLWIGSDPNTSVTDLDGKFHHINNAYVAGPALFPTLGSANPSLTAFTLAKRTAAAIVASAFPQPMGTASSLITPIMDGWQMAGSGRFNSIGDGVVESAGGIGLLWYTKQTFSDFVLNVQWRSINPIDNSGIFIRFPALGNSNPAQDWKIAVDQGYEIQIDDTGYNPDTNRTGDMYHITGAIYTLAPASSLASKPLGQWNTYEIEAIGPNIRVRLNGVPVSTLTNPGSRQLQGHIGLQNHHPGSRVQFRNIFIQKASAAAAAGR
jgi:choline dehydrogenase-like flavoprotein